MTSTYSLLFALIVKSVILYPQDTHNLHIKGKIVGAHDGSEIKLFKFKANENGVIYLSSTVIIKECFEFSEIVDEIPAELYLQFNAAKSSAFSVIYVDNSNIEIETTVEKYPYLNISGSSFHNQYLEYQRITAPLIKEKYKLYKEKQSIKYGDTLTASVLETKYRNLEREIQRTSTEFLNHHPNWLFTPVLIMQMFTSSFELKKEYRKLTKNIKNSKFGTKLLEKMKNAETKEAAVKRGGEFQHFLQVPFTSDDTLRGSINKDRSWWNVLRYDLSIKPDYLNKKIIGTNKIIFKSLADKNNFTIQIDLQEPLRIDSVKFKEQQLKYYKSPHSKNVWYILIDSSALTEVEHAISIYYSGSPHIASNPPWNGGWIWGKDKYGRPWISVACQGLGASVWYPCKDHQSDEPDYGVSITLTVPDSLAAISNGQLIKKTINRDTTASWTWEVKSPINNYDVAVYIGKYVNWHETVEGEKGRLNCEYWVLDYNLEKSKVQFAQVKLALRCFEYWFGPYPFYEDGYKLCDAPFAGMEHQSAIAYGSHFINGYPSAGGNSFDLSSTGWGLNWDYILVHETGHEWFGNNITTNDIADMWVQEGFTNYSETLFVEFIYGKNAANGYNQGLKERINNDKPVIGLYGVNKMGSNDMYAKGAVLIHMVRNIIDDDKLFRTILRDLNDTFYHKTVDTKDVEDFISQKAGMDFSQIFEQYLRTTQVPILEYKIQGRKLFYRWINCVENFSMPVRLLHPASICLNVTTKWKQIYSRDLTNQDLLVDPNFYIKVFRTN